MRIRIFAITLVAGLFTWVLSFNANAAPTWGPGYNTGVSLSRTFEQGTRGNAFVGANAAPASSYNKASASNSMFSENYNGFLSGTILESGPDCSNKGSAILEDGPCMKACPGKCDKPNYAPCDEPSCQKELPCCEEPVVAPAPCFPTAHPARYIQPNANPCAKFAPIDLQYVDFRIPEEGKSHYSKKLGNYRFRIFGCRRPAKNIMLNQGRTLQKDMRLINIFDRTNGDCLNIVKVPADICLNTRARLPEYILTAEIVDFHMNVCDEFDYEEAKTKNSRKGTSEITVVWRLMDLNKTTVLWKGVTSGYAELKDGETYGENILIEKAFADAGNSLRQHPEFETQLMKRVHPKELNRQRRILIDTQRLIDPVRCEYGDELKAIRQGKKAPKSLFEKQFTRRDGTKIYVTKDDVKIYQTKDGTITHIIRDGTSYPIDRDRMVINSDGTKTLYTSDGTRIIVGGKDDIISIEYEGGAPVIIEEVEIVEPVKIIEKVTVDEPIKVIEKVTVEEPVAIIEKVTSTPAVFEEEVEVVDRGGADSIFDVTLIEDDVTVVADSRICIYERGAYESLNPENMNMIKSSIVMVSNADGKKGSGLIVSEDLALTSANMVLKDKNTYIIRTADGRELTAKAFRVNVKKNIALLLFDQETTYTKLAIGLDLPRIGKDELTSLGILALDGIPFTTGKSFTQANGKTLGYRYSDDIGTELLVDTFIQGTTDGGAVIDEQGRYRGMSISGKRLGDGPDIFIPFETVLKSVGLEICGRDFEGVSGVSKLIEHPIAQAPEKMPKKERK